MEGRWKWKSDGNGSPMEVVEARWKWQWMTRLGHHTNVTPNVHNYVKFSRAKYLRLIGGRGRKF